MLKEHCCLSDTFCTFYHNQSVIPVYLLIEISCEAQISLSQQTAISLIQSIHLQKELKTRCKDINFTLKKQIFGRFFTFESKLVHHAISFTLYYNLIFLPLMM